MQRAHGFGDELQGRTVADQELCLDLAVVGVDVGGLEHQRIPTAPAQVDVGVGVAGQRHETHVKAGNLFFGDARGVIQADAWRGLAGGGERHVFAGNHRHDRLGGNGHVIVGQDCLDQEPGAGDGDHRNEPD
ncbi:hypothetical protein D3C81_1739100 [compost metagenome]